MFLALFARNHIFVYSTFDLTFDLEDDLESKKKYKKWIFQLKLHEKEVLHLFLPFFSEKSYLTLELTFDLEFCLVPHRIFLKIFSMLIWMYL